MEIHRATRAELRRIPLFADLPEAEAGRLAEASRVLCHDRNAPIFAKGDQPEDLYAVLSGTVKLACQSPDGGESVIALLRPGQTFGETAFLLDAPAPCLAAALGGVQILRLDGAVLRALIAASPAFCLRVLTHLAEGIFRVMRQIEALSLCSTQERFVRYLLDRQGTEAGEDGERPIVFPTTKRTLAALLGMAPESLSRNVRDLSDAGLIEVSRHRVEILDRQRLAARLGA